MHWHVTPSVQRVGVKLRSRGEPVAAQLVPGDDGRAHLEFGEPVARPAPGQVAVAYDEEEWIVAGGVIASERPGRCLELAEARYRCAAWSGVIERTAKFVSCLNRLHK